jgi:hypothetical protein
MTTTMQDRARARNGINKVTYPNGNVNMRGKIHGGKAAPKMMNMGKDTSRNAVNSRGKFTNNELSPSATSQSSNQ